MHKIKIIDRVADTGNDQADQCGSVGWASSHKVKGRWFDCRSGQMPGLQILSPVRAHKRGN